MSENEPTLFYKWVERTPVVKKPPMVFPPGSEPPARYANRTFHPVERYLFVGALTVPVGRMTSTEGGEWEATILLPGLQPVSATKDKDLMSGAIEDMVIAWFEQAFSGWTK